MAGFRGAKGFTGRVQILTGGNFLSGGHYLTGGNSLSGGHLCREDAPSTSDKKCPPESIPKSYSLGMEEKDVSRRDFFKTVGVGSIATAVVAGVREGEAAARGRRRSGRARWPSRSRSMAGAISCRWSRA